MCYSTTTTTNNTPPPPLQSVPLRVDLGHLLIHGHCQQFILLMIFLVAFYLFIYLFIYLFGLCVCLSLGAGFEEEFATFS
jgi:hypothetical protein